MTAMHDTNPDPLAAEVERLREQLQAAEDKLEALRTTTLGWLIRQRLLVPVERQDRDA